MEPLAGENDNCILNMVAFAVGVHINASEEVTGLINS
jgi:hypothetical protein